MLTRWQQQVRASAVVSQLDQVGQSVKQSVKQPVRQPVRPQQLALRLGCNEAGKTVLRDRFMAYPLSISPVFRLDADGSGTDAVSEQRAYLYRMNTSPGLLAGDVLGMSLALEAGSALYLADQAATKVHTMPGDGTKAAVHYEVAVGDRATLEFLPEPLILFADAELKQVTDITLHPTAGLTWGEIILPGRLARGECYEFREYWSTIRIKSPSGAVAFVETMKLLGKGNRFLQRSLFASGPVMGTLILGLPDAIATPETLKALSEDVDRLSADSIEIASSVLPQGNGLFVRAIAQKTQAMQGAFKAIATLTRKLRNQAPLPYSV
ncbi:MAG: urease accessory protein UreD [Cyanobacteria bacterium J06598_1]